MTPDIFLDTDIGPDCDDAAALAILAAACVRKQARMIGVTHCTGSPYGLATIDAILRAFDLRAPLGTCADRDYLSGEEMLRFTRPIACSFPNGFPPDAPQPDALAVFKTVLAGRADRSVTLTCIGPLRNIGRYLADEEGARLMKRKVRRVVLMGGCFERRPVIAEWNIAMEIAAAQKLVAEWAGETLFCPFETCEEAMVGSCLSRYPETAVYEAYRLYTDGRMLRPSWDLLAAVAALGALPAGVAYSEPGRVQVDAAGRTRFTPAPDGKHRYLRLTSSPAQLAAALEERLDQAAQGMTRGGDAHR